MKSCINTVLKTTLAATLLNEIPLRSLKSCLGVLHRRTEWVQMHITLVLRADGKMHRWFFAGPRMHVGVGCYAILETLAEDTQTSLPKDCVIERVESLILYNYVEPTLLGLSLGTLPEYRHSFTRNGVRYLE